jgi:hypothetical protein
MLEKANVLICLILFGLVMTLSIAASAGAVDNVSVNDTVELKNGDKLAGTVLNHSFTVITPYTNIALEKDNISEIKIDFESENHDVITLNTGGLMEGTIEEPSLSFKLSSGKVITLEKKECKNIIFNKNR